MNEEVTNKKYLEEIERLRAGDTIKRDPQLIGYIVMNWYCTEEAGLRRFAWTMCKDDYVTQKDALFLLEKIEEYLTKDERSV